MFNDTQKKIYEETWGFIQDKLNFYVSKILEIGDSKQRQDSLNALYFNVNITMSLDKNTQRLLYQSLLNPETSTAVELSIQASKIRVEKTSRYFFPAEGHHQLRGFFSKLHDFFYGQDSRHIMITSIIDPRFFASEDKGEQKLKQTKLLIDLGKQLKQDCHLWLVNERRLKRFDQKNMPLIEKHLIAAGVIDAPEEAEQKESSQSAGKWSQLRSSS